MGSRNSTCLPKISPFPAFPQGFWRRIVPLTERSIKRLPVKEVNRWKQFNNRRWAKDWIVAFGRGECCRHNFGSHLQPYFRSQMHVLLNRWDRWDRPEYRKYRLRDLCSVRSPSGIAVRVWHSRNRQQFLDRLHSVRCHRAVSESSFHIWDRSV